MGTKLADIKSAKKSKINATQVISLIVAIAAIFGYVIPEDWQLTALKATSVATPVVTMIWRTWFNKTVAP